MNEIFGQKFDFVSGEHNIIGDRTRTFPGILGNSQKFGISKILGNNVKFLVFPKFKFLFLTISLILSFILTILLIFFNCFFATFYTVYLILKILTIILIFFSFFFTIFYLLNLLTTILIFFSFFSNSLLNFLIVYSMQKKTYHYTYLLCNFFIQFI